MDVGIFVLCAMCAICVFIYGGILSKAPPPEKSNLLKPIYENKSN